MSLKNINFSNGIRSEDIQYNFENLEDQIAKERLSIAGHGVSSGLDFSIDNFNIKINHGMLIDVTGKEISIKESNVKIPYPIMTQVNVDAVVESDGKISLPDIPYSTSGKCAAQYDDVPANYGIRIVDAINSSRTLSVISINNKIITTDARWEGQRIKVFYFKTEKRKDVIYIDMDNKIKIAIGLTSNSPDAPTPEDCKYILGTVNINPHYIKPSGEIVANISVDKDMKNLRTIYTDNKNELYIQGIKFDNLQIIEMIEPAKPTIDQLWYDTDSNKLKVWKTVDGISEWFNVNDTSIIPVREFKLWEPHNNPENKQEFIFHMTEDMNMRFIPNRNELEIYIDNGPLHSDQFEEITTEDVLINSTLKQKLIKDYGYTEEWINQANTNYDNIGIGFKLARPLDKACYVEVRATHRVNDSATRVRFQRSATFVDSDSFYYKEAEGNVVTTKIPYKVSENQLEVFMDGKRLDATLDFIEGIDLSINDRIKGTTSSQFQIITYIPENSKISYKITTNIYSYDNIDLMIGELGTKVAEAEESISTKLTEVSQFVDSTNNNMIVMQNKINLISEKEAEHEEFLKKIDNLNVRIPKGLINMDLIKTSNTMESPGIYPEDFVMIFDTQSESGSNVLMRGSDFNIEMDDNNNNLFYITFSESIPNGHKLYITGIKFKSEEVSQ